MLHFTSEIINPRCRRSEAAGYSFYPSTVILGAWYYGRGANAGEASPFKWNVPLLVWHRTNFIALTPVLQWS